MDNIIKREQFAASYVGKAPWDIDRPQPALFALAQRGELKGKVLDAGCGTGEHTLMAAALGLEAVGVDIVDSAIEMAKNKAKERNLNAQFFVGDALRLEDLHQSFDTALDSGLFHTFSDEDRVSFEKSLRAVLKPGGRYFMLCFSEHQLGEGGPRRITQQVIKEVFKEGWRVDSIEATKIDSLLPFEIQAWLASMTRVEG